MLLKKVRAGEAIDTMLRDCTYITYKGKVTKLTGSAHKTWVLWRGKTWLIPI